MNLLKIRKRSKKRKPAFLRCNATSLKRLHGKWRRPRGKQNKQRKHNKGRGSLPRPGYGSPKEIRGMHPSGMREVLVTNINDLTNIDNQTSAARISATVGKKKKIEMMKIAAEKKIRVLNPINEAK